MWEQFSARTLKCYFMRHGPHKNQYLLKKSSRSTSALPATKDDDGFIMPSQKNTPGRSRATRTQSEVNMGRTRPPQGSGSIFAMDEEAGEMFSSSYLSDMKLGICAVDK